MCFFKYSFQLCLFIDFISLDLIIHVFSIDFLTILHLLICTQGPGHGLSLSLEGHGLALDLAM